MIIDKVAIDSVYLYPENPREIEASQFEKLKKNIKEFGFIDPLVVNMRDDPSFKKKEKVPTIIGGNMRWRALKELGFKEVEIVKVNLNRTKEAILNIALNRISGRWDIEKLEKMVYTLSDKDLNIDLTLTGLEDWEQKLYNPGDDTPLEEIKDIPLKFLEKEGESGRKFIVIDKIEPSGINPNQMTAVEFNGLKKSMVAIGIINPITVREKDNHYIIVDGEHRWQAAKELGWKKIPISLVKMNDLEAKQAIIAANRIKGRFNSGLMATVIKDLAETDEEGLKKATAMDKIRVKEYVGLEGSPLLEGEASRRELRDYERGKDYDAPGSTMTLIIALPVDKYNFVSEILNKISSDWAEAIVKLCEKK